jgi:hypothetical protein
VTIGDAELSGVLGVYLYRAIGKELACDLGFSEHRAGMPILANTDL